MPSMLHYRLNPVHFLLPFAMKYPSRHTTSAISRVVLQPFSPPSSPLREVNAPKGYKLHKIRCYCNSGTYHEASTNTRNGTQSQSETKLSLRIAIHSISSYLRDGNPDAMGAQGQPKAHGGYGLSRGQAQAAIKKSEAIWIKGRRKPSAL